MSDHPSNDTLTRCIISHGPKRQVGASWKLDRVRKKAQDKNQKSHKLSSMQHDFLIAEKLLLKFEPFNECLLVTWYYLKYFILLISLRLTNI